jgi:hypothetical protein
MRQCSGMSPERRRSEARGEYVAPRVGAYEDAKPPDEWVMRPSGRAQVGDRDVADDDEPDELVGEETERPTAVRPYDAGEIHGYATNPSPARCVRAGESSEALRRDPARLPGADPRRGVWRRYDVDSRPVEAKRDADKRTNHALVKTSSRAYRLEAAVWSILGRRRFSPSVRRTAPRLRQCSGMSPESG